MIEKTINATIGTKVKINKGSTFYIENKQGINICNPKLILDQFENVRQYEEFLDENTKYLKEKKEMERYLIEE